jgi:hypothetical protein
VLQLYARSRFGFNIDRNVDKSFGAPPLLNEELEAGRLDAVLTYWPFAAKLEARGMPPLLTIGDALAGLGIARDLPLTGYVFFAGWAAENRTALDGFLAASREAKAILEKSDAEWERIAPLTGARDAAELTKLRDAYRRGTFPGTGHRCSDAALPTSSGDRRFRPCRTEPGTGAGDVFSRREILTQTSMARFSAAVAGRAVSLLLLLAVWEAAARLVHSRLFPGAAAILVALYDETVHGELLHHLSTISRASS